MISVHRSRLSKRDLSRIQRLQAEMARRAAIETELRLADLMREYDAFLAELEPIRQEMLNLAEAGNIDDAARKADELGRKVIAWLLQRGERESALIQEIIQEAAILGAQAADLPASYVRNPTGSLNEAIEELDPRPAASVITNQDAPDDPRWFYNVVGQQVKDAIWKRVYEDGLNLSQRLHTRLAQHAQELNQIIVRGVQSGRAAVQLAREIQALDITDPRLPKYLKRLVDLVRGTPAEKLVKEIEKSIPEMMKRKPGPLGIRGPSKKLIQAVASGSLERVDKAVQYFLERKARYHAIVIARTETQNAYRAGHVAKALETPYVIGIRWHLSGSHVERKRPCGCEELANADLYGLGKGVYPPDKLPERPHPNCMCYFTDVIDMDRLLALAPIDSLPR